MKVREVVVIGDGLAGCAVAYELIKRDIPVSIVSLYPKKRTQGIFQSEGIEAFNTLKLHEGNSQLCPRAFENMTSWFQKIYDEWFSTASDEVNIHAELYEKLIGSHQVEWLNRHVPIELLTLEKDSNKILDKYKKPTCFGVKIFCRESHQVENFLAKEVIIATEDYSSLYSYSTQHNHFGSGLAMSHRAGVRLLNMGISHFHPLGLYTSKGICIPLPLDLLVHGGKIYCQEEGQIEEIKDRHAEEILQIIYRRLLKNHISFLKLDLSEVKKEFINDKYPRLMSLLKDHDVNLFQDELRVIPCVVATEGGAVVDKTAQSSLQRLRFVGENAVTGLNCEPFSRVLKDLESLVWANSCAEDIAKMMHRFAYYFPEIEDKEEVLQSGDSHLEAWHILKQVMWLYGGIHSNSLHGVDQGIVLLHALQSVIEKNPKTIEEYFLLDAIEVARLVLQAKNT